MRLRVVHTAQRQAYLQRLLNRLLDMEATGSSLTSGSWASFRVTTRSPAALPASSSATSICSGMGEDLAIAKRVVDRRARDLCPSFGKGLIEDDDVNRKEDVVDRGAKTRPLLGQTGPSSISGSWAIFSATVRFLLHAEQVRSNDVHGLSISPNRYCYSPL